MIPVWTYSQAIHKHNRVVQCARYTHTQYTSVRLAVNLSRLNPLWKSSTSCTSFFTWLALAAHPDYPPKNGQCSHLLWWCDMRLWWRQTVSKGGKKLLGRWQITTGGRKVKDLLSGAVFVCCWLWLSTASSSALFGSLKTRNIQFFWNRPTQLGQKCKKRAKVRTNEVMIN